MIRNLPFKVPLVFFFCLSILVFISLFRGGIFNNNLSWAATAPPKEEPKCKPSMNTWTETLYDGNEYMCQSAACGTNILERERLRKYECWDDGCGDSGCTFSGFVYTDPVVFRALESWQRCEPYQGNWADSVPAYGCQGNCLETPQNPGYYDNPTYSNQPSQNIGNENISLPVKLDWNDVAGWGQNDGPQSYVMRITTSTAPFSEALNQSEYIPRACLLPSNVTSNWGVKACCSAAGTNCGGESNWNLTANSAPEPISPYDPDWVGEEGAKNIALPVTLDWCDVEEAQSYRLKIFVIEGGKTICHPDLLSTIEGKETCDSWLLRKTRRDPEQIDKALYSDFFDENMDFFTKNTDYAWQTTICDENGDNCKIDSQLWKFSTKEVPLETSFLVSPTNDPTGKTPVGLPLVLDWNDKPGVNSFIYEVAPAAGGEKISETAKVSQSKSFNFPELSLNTLYKWKVKSCWDYLSQKCEPNFSEEWYFKTTGQAPNLTSPASGEQNAVIPVNFAWENVPGAKSYVLKVSGNGLNLVETSNKPEFSLDFPEYPIRQETDYSWQVKTCAWDEGKTCGQYSGPQSFKTFRLPPPQNPSPANNGQFFTNDKYVSWGKVPGAKAYQYQIKYVSLSEKETDATCPTLVGKDLFAQPKTALANSDFVELKCLGGYQWQARSCLDNNCQEISNWSNAWSFTYLEGGTGQNGLVPCGRANNNPKTPWNEREPCQIKHLFLSVKIMIDFLLLRVIPIILVLLTIATALIFYTSLGQIMTMAQVISLWKAAGIGLAIIFFAWTIVNIFLKLIGYNIGVFGNWYQLPI